VDDWPKNFAEVTAGDIPDCITGKFEVGLSPWTVQCEGIDVCRYKDGVLVAIACDHPSHGCHPKFKAKYERFRKAMAKLREKSPSISGPCPKCDGEGWLAPNSPEARHTVLLSMAVGMWRGIAFPGKDLSLEELGVTIRAFLSGAEPGDASSGPTEVAAFGRAKLIPSADGTGTKKNKGAGNG